MKLHRIFGVMLRHLFMMKRSLDIASNIFYWPIIDLLLWGLASLYMSSLAPGSDITHTIIVCILFWIIVWRGQYEITVSFLYEVWERNLVNIFVSPVLFSEWTIALLIISIIKTFISFAFASLVAFFLYKVSIFSYGFSLIPFILLLLINGWWVGFLITSVLMRFGTKIQALAWTTLAALGPFSGIYYPVAILPKWAQTIAHCLPSSYVFEVVREMIKTGYVDKHKILVSFSLNMVYLLVGILLMRRSFKKIFDQGFAKLQ